jgi:capsular exopolysaccharide synthesis family protein
MASSAPAPAPAATSDVDIRFYLGLLWRGRALVATGAGVGLLNGLLAGFAQTPEYRASAMLQIEPPTPTFLTVTDALVGGGNYWQHADFYNPQFKVLTSKGVGEKAVERLKLQDQPPFQGHPDAGSLFMSHVAVEPVPDSRLVNVVVTHRDPKEAALWANTVGEVYIEQSLNSRVESARKAYEWLQERLAVTQKSMREAQDRLFKSYQSQDLFVPEGSVSAVTSSITKLGEDLVEVQGKRIAREAALKQIEQARASRQSLDTVPQVAVDSRALSLSGQLATLQLERSRLKEKFKDAHPEVQKVQAQIEQLQKAKDERARQIVGGLEAELGQLRKQESEIRAAIDTQKAQASRDSRKGAELEALRKESDSSKNLYEVLLQKLNETDIAASIRNNNVSMIERAVPPHSPVRPQKVRIALMALAAGLVLGVALVLVRDFFDNTIKDPEEIERYLHLDLLAAVPRFGEADRHFATEAFQSLRTALLFARREDTGQVVLITGTAPQEGKTTTLVNLAQLLAASGEPTVVIDCDLRRAQLHARLGLSREPGLTDHFVQHIPLDTLLRPTGVANLLALPAGALPPNPPALLARKGMTELLDDLRRRFAWVLVDSPPLASVTDALLLARQADTTVFVVQHNAVDKRLVKRSVAALKKSGAHVLGVVLNAVPEVARSDYYYYSYRPAAEVPAAAPTERRPGS